MQAAESLERHHQCPATQLSVGGKNHAKLKLCHNAGGKCPHEWITLVSLSQQASVVFGFFFLFFLFFCCWFLRRQLYDCTSFFFSPSFLTPFAMPWDIYKCLRSLWQKYFLLVNWYSTSSSYNTTWILNLALVFTQKFWVWMWLLLWRMPVQREFIKYLKKLQVWIEKKKS